MRIDIGRWGEITIKKQGEKKNKFDKTKSFSIANTDYEYSIDELKEVLSIVINLTEKYKFEKLKKLLNGLK